MSIEGAAAEELEKAAPPDVASCGAPVQHKVAALKFPSGKDDPPACRTTDEFLLAAGAVVAPAASFACGEAGGDGASIGHGPPSAQTLHIASGTPCASAQCFWMEMGEE